MALERGVSVGVEGEKYLSPISTAIRRWSWMKGVFSELAEPDGGELGGESTSPR